MRYVLPPAPLTTGETPLLGWGVPSRANRFIISNDLDELGRQRKVVLATLQSAVGVFTTNVSDTELFDATFEQALVSLLAFKLVIPLTGNAGMRAEFKTSAVEMINSARAVDGNEAISSTDHTPDWIAARGSPMWSPAGMDIGNWYIPYDNVNWGG